MSVQNVINPAEQKGFTNTEIQFDFYSSFSKEVVMFIWRGTLQSCPSTNQP
jgi:hypothetical protein